MLTTTIALLRWMMVFTYLRISLDGKENLKKMGERKKKEDKFSITFSRTWLDFFCQGNLPHPRTHPTTHTYTFNLACSTTAHCTTAQNLTWLELVRKEKNYIISLLFFLLFILFWKNKISLTIKNIFLIKFSFKLNKKMWKQ